SNDNIKAGTVQITGRTTAGCKLYVNGTQLEVSEDGSFNGEYMLSSVQRETIRIASVDPAGNETDYAVEILNSEMANLLKVYLSPEIQQLTSGDSIQMRLYGVTKDNKEILLGNDKVEWQIYDKEGAAALNGDGLLTGVKAGEVIVTGRYELSGETAFEDALLIKVVPKSESNNSDEGDRDNDRENRSRTDNLSGILKTALSFQAGEEIDIPGLIKLRFTGNESSPEGSIQVFEIKELTKYRQLSGPKDFRSNIFDILLPDGYKLSSPLELTLYYDRNKVNDIKHIAIYFFNEEKGLWDLAGGTVDEHNSIVTVKMPQMGKYAVMENSGMILMADLNGHWARDSVYRLMDRGIVNGIKTAEGEYRFEPERTVTRAEFAKLLSMAAGYREKDAVMSLTDYRDVGDIQPWALPYLWNCSEKGWIKGRSKGSEVYIKPNDSITRAEAAVMIARSLGIDPDAKIKPAGFSDRDSIPSWAAAYIEQLQEKRLLMGYSDGSFKPDRVLTRAEAAKIFDKYVYGKENGF
ncbi:MAG: S-layer homology domain-containing protein, partial [Pseudomonadota bacterium]